MLFQKLYLRLKERHARHRAADRIVNYCWSRPVVGAGPGLGGEQRSELLLFKATQRETSPHASRSHFMPPGCKTLTYMIFLFRQNAICSKGLHCQWLMSFFFFLFRYYDVGYQVLKFLIFSSFSSAKRYIQDTFCFSWSILYFISSSV